MNGKEVDGKLEEFGQNIVVSKLTVPQLRREHRNTTYKCRAANTHLIPPLEKTVILDVYRECLSPLESLEFSRTQKRPSSGSRLFGVAQWRLLHSVRAKKKRRKTERERKKCVLSYLEFSLMKILKIQINIQVSLAFLFEFVCEFIYVGLFPRRERLWSSWESRIRRGR